VIDLRLGLGLEQEALQELGVVAAQELERHAAPSDGSSAS
jgi:hypothetical protein